MRMISGRRSVIGIARPLGPVEGGVVPAAGAVEVVAEPVAVQELHGASGRHHDHAWNEYALLLVHLDSRRHTRTVPLIVPAPENPAPPHQKARPRSPATMLVVACMTILAC